MAPIFEDRKANRPNRYKVTPDSGSPYYITLERADEPSVLGTPLNATVLNELYSPDNKPTAPEIGAIPADNSRTDIPNNSDLNSSAFLRVGAWRAPTTAVATSLKNCPVTMAFTLDVVSGTGRDNQATESSGYILQKITTQTGEQYFRRVYGSTDGRVFNNWTTIVNSGNIHLFGMAVIPATVE